jgi:hypothetical protein
MVSDSDTSSLGKRPVCEEEEDVLYHQAKRQQRDTLYGNGQQSNASVPTFWAAVSVDRTVLFTSLKTNRA